LSSSEDEHGLLILTHRTEKKHDLVTNSASSDALQSQNLSNFEGRLLQSQIVASKGL
jgi:hypothetical protein